MMRRTNLHEDIFNLFKAHGRELSLGEIRRAIPSAGTGREGYQKAIRKCQRVFRSRWNEIYDTKLGVVHTPKPEPIKVQKPEPVEAPEKPEVDPLEALKQARSTREEHE